MAVQLGGVILGAVIYYIVYQVIIFAGFDTDLLKMFSAVVVARVPGCAPRQSTTESPFPQ